MKCENEKRCTTKKKKKKLNHVVGGFKWHRGGLPECSEIPTAKRKKIFVFSPLLHKNSGKRKLKYRQNKQEKLMSVSQSNSTDMTTKLHRQQEGRYTK